MSVCRTRRVTKLYKKTVAVRSMWVVVQSMWLSITVGSAHDEPLWKICLAVLWFLWQPLEQYRVPVLMPGWLMKHKNVNFSPLFGFGLFFPFVFYPLTEGEEIRGQIIYRADVLLWQPKNAI